MTTPNIVMNVPMIILSVITLPNRSLPHMTLETNWMASRGARTEVEAKGNEVKLRADPHMKTTVPK
eukprot:CAMPEP_0119512500 /NCGR_PEP_ID=MMETSP1344-20130328/30852_1 /TAXON_ID=236787 /ORGANISM="Florenciella parvula, Strain CCMP2471" /LENGTH=65 /DNA_ID=CAMNT_0007549621 /DNA_START=69 /DNA_END=263 /DNA_ORIENTATION=+